MRETLGVPPVVPARRRSSSRIPVWSWLFAAIGLSFMVSAAILVERSVHYGRGPRVAAPSFATKHRTREVCDAATKRLADVALQAERCGDPHVAEFFREGRSEVLLAFETAHDDASVAELYDACESVLLDLPDFVCR